MERFQTADKFMVLGRSGSGKTTLASCVAECYPRVVTFDSTHEFTPRDGELVSGFDQFAKKILEKKKTGAERFRIIYQFDLELEDTVEEFNQALRVLYYFGGVFVRIEEIQNFSSAHRIPKWLSHCLTTGRHRKMGMIFTTQMPRYCNKALISQAAHVFCGQLHEKNDVEYARSILGNRADELPHIPERKFLYFRPGQPIRVVNNSLD